MKKQSKAALSRRPFQDEISKKLPKPPKSLMNTLRDRFGHDRSKKTTV